MDERAGRADEPYSQRGDCSAHHYDSHHQLRQHIQTFLDAYNFAKRLKTLNGLTPFESVCKAWTKEPNRFKYDPVQLSSGLHTYGPNLPDMNKRAGTYVDRILKGATAGELPIERPTKFELVVNLKTAKALGLDVPPTLLRLANEVIE